MDKTQQNIEAYNNQKQKLESELRSGTRVVMEMFPVPGWKPTKIIIKDGKRFFLYAMPPETQKETETRDPLIDYLNYYSSHQPEKSAE